MAQLVVKKKKKVWYNIICPKDFGDFVIAETMASEPTHLMGRSVKVSLSELMGDPKKQNFQVTFKVIEVSEKTANTDLVRYELMPSYLRRMMRKERAKVEDSFTAVTKDNIKVRIKPMIITKSKTKRSVLTAIMMKTREHLSEVLKELKYAEFINDVISTKAQKTLREQLKKIYPVAVLEFRVVERA